jgi:hypothetical protein
VRAGGSVVLGILLAAACSGGRYSGPAEGQPAVVFPAPFAEGSPQVSDAGLEASAPAPAEPALRKVGSLPDPEPLRTERQWQYEFVYDAGALRVASVRAMLYPKPIVTARKMGRYAVELWIGRELVERVRFDFPLTAADEPASTGPKPLREPPALGAGAKVVQRVLVPASPRATRALLVDRATEQAVELPWPPDRPLNQPIDGGDQG